GFFGRKTTTYRNHIVNKAREDKIYDIPSDIVVAEDASKKDNNFWDTIRHEPLNQKEQGIFNMVDSIKDVKVFRTFYDIMNAIITYYYVLGKFEFGPYFTIYSFNNVEGNRIRIGGRTSNKISTKYMIESYIAYGTKDQRFKYGGNFIYIFNKNPRKAFSLDYKHDMEQLGQSIMAFSEDNILSSTFRRGPQYTLSMVNQFKTSYEHEWFQGFSNTIRLKWREQFPFENQQFVLFNDFGTSDYYSSFITSEISINTRYAYNEKFVMGEFERISLGTKYPVINFTATAGLKNILGSQFSFQKLQLTIDHWFNTYPLGYGKYIIDAGKIFGKLPYPLLKLHEGNQTYFFDEYAFNLMNYYEFVSDQWISLTYTHYFDGFFLNKIPLMRKLKWRELAWSKGLLGFLNQENLNYMPFPSTLNTLDRSQDIKHLKPYVEAGIGIENIFKFIRVDAIWRLSYLNNPNISKFGIRMSMYFKF
ncbi:MAG: carboxypeptidase-like regulatory domain-containing protein, partial [Bacteroidales bacterium]|nr:carboxypeptidase-like regulatory domain-containing protein [Bacteroidales bacterium]